MSDYTMMLEHEYLYDVEEKTESFLSIMGKILRFFVAYHIILFGSFMAYVYCFNRECFMALASLAVLFLGVVYLATPKVLYSYKVSSFVFISLGFYLYNL
jgi:hypothetical protein